MSNLHGIIYAYLASPAMGDLVRRRTSSSLPFCARYRLIDFALSSMVNAGVSGVGVIMQRDYQSLLDHIKSGKDWDLDRSRGGLRILPPFGLPETSHGEYRGDMEALAGVKSYVEDIPEENVVLMRGDIIENIDLAAAFETHLRLGTGLTAVVTQYHPRSRHHCFVPDGDSIAREFLIDRSGDAPGLASLEVYILTKPLLLELIDLCESAGKLHFHNDALFLFLSRGGKIALHEYDGYARRISTVRDYYSASMDMLRPENRAQIFLPERPVHTKERAEVSTYYSEQAEVKNSLIADGCIIEGTVENCVLFRGVRVSKDVHLKDCIIMQDSRILEGSVLSHIVCDKDVEVTSGSTIFGSPHLPMVIPKGIRV